MRDIDAEANQIYQTCVDAGPSICPLYEESANLVEKRIKNIIGKLTAMPVPYSNATTGTYDVIDGSDVKMTLFKMLYKPHTIGSTVFSAISEIEKGNTGPMAQIYPRAGLRDALACECPATPPSMLNGGGEVEIAIACGECEEVNDGIPQLMERYQRVAKYSAYFTVLFNRWTFCS